LRRRQVVPRHCFEAVGYGKWKVRLNDGTVEELISRMLKKVELIL
jgi:hypothetical protein